MTSSALKHMPAVASGKMELWKNYVIKKRARKIVRNETIRTVFNGKCMHLEGLFKDMMMMMMFNDITVQASFI